MEQYHHRIELGSSARCWPVSRGGPGQCGGAIGIGPLDFNDPTPLTVRVIGLVAERVGLLNPPAVGVVGEARRVLSASVTLVSRSSASQVLRPHVGKLVGHRELPVGAIVRELARGRVGVGDRFQPTVTVIGEVGDRGETPPTPSGSGVVMSATCPESV